MRTRRFSAALCGLVAMLSVAAAAERSPPVAVIGSFIDPGYSEQAIFSADAALLALPDSGSLWDVTSGLPLRNLNDPVFMMSGAFSPDGQMFVSGHKDGGIKLWSVASGAVIGSLGGKKDRSDSRINSIWIDRKGEFVVSGDHTGTVKLWRLANRRAAVAVQVRQPGKGDGTPDIVAARLSADGKRLIVLANANYRGPGIFAEYDARTGAEKSWTALPALHAFPDHGYVDDNQALVTSYECERGEIKLWGFRERAVITGIHKPETCDRPKDNYDDAVKIFSGLQSSRAVIVLKDSPDLLVWDVAARKLERTIRWPGQDKPANVIGVSHDLKSVAVAEPGAVHIRTLESGDTVEDLRAFGVAARNVVARGPDVQVMLQQEVREDKPAIDIDVRGRALQPATAHFTPGGVFTACDFAPDAKIAMAGSEKGELLVLPLEPGKEPRKLAIEGLREVWRCWLSPDGKLAGLVAQIGKDDDSADVVGMLIDTADGKVLYRFESDEDNSRVTAFAFTLDGSKFAAGRRNGKVELWDARALKQIKMLPPASEDGDVTSLAFSPDGRFLAGSGAFDGTVFYWDVVAGKLVRSLDLGDGYASYHYASLVAMSHDGKSVAAGLSQRHTSSGDNGSERGNVLIWDAANGKLRFTLRAARYAIYALAFSPDDRFVIVGSLDGTVRYWERATGRLMATTMSNASGGWLVLTESGFYAGSDGSDASLAVVRGARAVPATRVRAQLYKPDLVENLLKADGTRYRDAARKLDLPAVLKSAAH